MRDRALYVLPLATVLVVAFALFVVGAPRPYVGARLYGGPTEGAPVLAWRLEAVEDVRSVEIPVRLDDVRVEVTLAGGVTASWNGGTDADGRAQVRIEPPAPVEGPVSVRVTTPVLKRPLAEGPVTLPLERWTAGAKSHGGWIDGRQQGGLTIRVAAERGVFAVPFQDRLRIDVHRGTEPVVGAILKLEPQGAQVLDAGKVVKTDAHGTASVPIVPREHVVSLTVTAEVPDVDTDDESEGDDATVEADAGAASDATVDAPDAGPDATNGSVGPNEGRWHGSLPIKPGALHAELRGTELTVRSAIPRERAYVAIVSRTARHAGGVVALETAPNGLALGTMRLDLARLPPGPLWAVVSTESDFRSMALVGWPLRVVPDGPPATTFAPVDELLLDGLELAADFDEGRRERARWLAGLFIAASALLMVIMLFRRVRTSQRNLEAHFRRASDESDDEAKTAPTRGGAGYAVVVAVLCVALGFAVIGLVAMLKML